MRTAVELFTQELKKELSSSIEQDKMDAIDNLATFFKDWERVQIMEAYTDGRFEAYDVLEGKKKRSKSMDKYYQSRYGKF